MNTYKLYRSPVSKYKYRIVLPSGKNIDFGQAGAEDFTMHKDVERWRRYITRHGGDINENQRPNNQPLTSSKEDWSINGIDTKGFWSRWYSWSHPDVDRSIQEVEKRFNIKIENYLDD
jgi:hypothetical protein